LFADPAPPYAPSISVSPIAKTPFLLFNPFSALMPQKLPELIPLELCRPSLKTFYVACTRSKTSLLPRSPPNRVLPGGIRGFPSSNHQRSLHFSRPTLLLVFSLRVFAKPCPPSLPPPPLKGNPCFPNRRLAALSRSDVQPKRCHSSCPTAFPTAPPHAAAALDDLPPSAWFTAISLGSFPSHSSINQTLEYS